MTALTKVAEIKRLNVKLIESNRIAGEYISRTMDADRNAQHRLLNVMLKRANEMGFLKRFIYRRVLMRLIPHYVCYPHKT